MGEDDVDDNTSYGTGYSSDGYLEPDNAVATEGTGDGIAALHAAIASIGATQAIVIDKLTLLERAVATVQFDMMWVRDEMKVVHNVMKKIAEHVSDVRDAATEVERIQEQVPMDANPKQTCIGKGQEDNVVKAPSASTSRGEEVYVDEDDPCRSNVPNEAGSFIEETQPFENDVNTYMTTVSSPDGERERVWGRTQEAPHAFDSPPRQPTRESINVEFLEEESQQIEMSCPGSQLETTMSGRSMWKDFAAAVKDWPPPPANSNGLGEGWVTTKKARWDTVDYGQDRVNTSTEVQVEPHAALNLNMPPEKQVTVGVSKGGWDGAPSKSNVGSSKSGGIGRGTSRATRPPAVQPQFHRTVGIPSAYPVGGCGGMILGLLRRKCHEIWRFVCP